MSAIIETRTAWLLELFDGRDWRGQMRYADPDHARVTMAELAALHASCGHEVTTGEDWWQWTGRDRLTCWRLVPVAVLEAVS